MSVFSKELSTEIENLIDGRADDVLYYLNQAHASDNIEDAIGYLEVAESKAKRTLTTLEELKRMAKDERNEMKDEE